MATIGRAPIGLRTLVHVSCISKVVIMLLIKKQVGIVESLSAVIK